MLVHPMTVVTGCMARSVRDVCRWYDVTTGADERDPYSLPKIEGWERNLGSRDLPGDSDHHDNPAQPAR